jgi:hypothetical protein
VSKPLGYWSQGEGGGQRRRAALESFAKESGFNPLVAENWYSVVRKDALENNKVQ